MARKSRQSNLFVPYPSEENERPDSVAQAKEEEYRVPRVIRLQQPPAQGDAAIEYTERGKAEEDKRMCDSQLSDYVIF